MQQTLTACDRLLLKWSNLVARNVSASLVKAVLRVAPNPSWRRISDRDKARSVVHLPSSDVTATVAQCFASASQLASISGPVQFWVWQKAALLTVAAVVRKRAALSLFIAYKASIRRNSRSGAATLYTTAEQVLHG